MVDPTPSDYHLTYLRERWERDRSSRIFLQLAEEYRRRGLHTEALEVLETGLGFHPGYLAAQVALGRCRLEAGQADVAVKVLERVLTQDPTQAVATRLLAESWLQLGDEDRAQAAIDRCRLIGIPPSELVGLEQRMAAARRAARDRWIEPIEAPAVPAAGPTRLEPAEETPLPWHGADEPASGAALASPVALPPTAPTPVQASPEQPQAALARPAAAAPSPSAVAAPGGAGDVFHLPALARPMLVSLRAAGERSLAGARTGDPFGSMSRRRPRSPAAAEIFHLVPAAGTAPPTPAAVEPAAVLTAPPAPTPPAVATPSPAPQQPPASAVSPDAPTVVLTPRLAGPSRWWDRPTEPALAPGAAELLQLAAAEPVVAPSVPAAVSAVPPAAAGASLMSPLADTPGVELQQSGSLAAPELRPSDPGTATLGELYLRQGYVREAEEIFKQVLERDADNEAALSGLEAIGRRRAQKLTAAELLAGPEPPEEKEVRGLTARKIQLLTRYLRTLRRGTDVPGTAQ